MINFFNSMFGTKEQVDLDKLIKEGAFLVDVRTASEFNGGHPKGSVNIPLDTLENNIAKFKNKASVIVFCRSGNRSGQAKIFLDSKGINNVYNGGTWGNVAKYTGE